MKRALAYFFASILSLAAFAAGTDDLLSPEQAFKPSLQKKDDHTFLLHIDIAEGYYLYRDRMHFSLQSGDGTLTPTFPEGKVKHDDYFGDVVTYRHSVDVPLVSTAVIAADAKVKVVTQGCADAGVCYPPQTTTLGVGSNKMSNALLQALLGDERGPDAADAPAKAPQSSVANKPATKTAAADLLAGAKPAPVGNAAPIAKAKDTTRVSPTLKASSGKPTVVAPDAVKNAATPADVESAPSAPVQAANNTQTAAPQEKSPGQPAKLAPSSTIPAGPFDGLSGPALLLAFYLAGLGMAATVCMYPLVPIVSSLIVGDGGHASKARGFVLSLAYVQGIGFVYAVVGAVAALSGSFLIVALQKPEVIGAMALIFVLLALSMYGLFSLQLPSSVQSKVNDASNRVSGGRLIPVFIMGALSSLIVGACMGPPLFAALTIVGTRANLGLGIIGFYLMAMGVGTPLVIVGVAGGHVLPKAGPWMTQVKNVFGTVMLGVALWIAHPILPDWLFMLGWAVLAIGSGVALSALDSLPTHAKMPHRIGKAFGVMFVLFGAAQTIGLLAGSRDPLQPLRPLAVAQAGTMQSSSVQSAKSQNHLAFQNVTSPAELDAALKQAQGKPLMLDFYADWCVSCREMEAQTFSDPKVQQAMSKYILLKADVTANTDSQRALLKRFGLFGPPGTIFFGAGGRESAPRLIGFEASDAFIQRIATP